MPPGPRELRSKWSATSTTTPSDGAPQRAPTPRPLDPVAELFAACQAADATRILLVLSGANAPTVNVRDNLMRTPLFYAIDRANIECVTLLLNVYQADASAADSSRNTPLHHAADVNNVEIARLLLQQPRVNVNAVNYQGATALHNAVAHSAVALYHLLVEAGANPRAVDAQGRTPLHLACENGCEEIVSHLVQSQQANVLAADAQGKLPLHYAAAKGAIGAVLQLVEVGLDVSPSTQSTATAAATSGSDAAGARHLEKVAKLLHCRDKAGKIPLHYAVEHDCVEVVHYLLELGPDAVFDTLGQKKKTMLIFAAERDNVSVVEAILEARGKVPTRRKPSSGLPGLLGFTVAHRTESEEAFLNDTANNETALYVALETQSFRVATLLLRRGCAIHDAYGILMDACRRGDLAMLQVLVNVRSVPLSAADAAKQFPVSSTMNIAGSRVARDNASAFGDVSRATPLQAACLQPEVLAFLLLRTDQPVHGPSAGEISTKASLRIGKDKGDSAHVVAKLRGSPLQIVCRTLLEPTPAQPRAESSFNPLAAFGRWLLGLQAPAAAEHTPRNYAELLRQHNRRRLDAIAALTLMIEHRGRELRLRLLPLERRGAVSDGNPPDCFLDAMWQLNGDEALPLDLWRLCLHNEAAHHGLLFRTLATAPAADASDAASRWAVHLVMQLCKREKTALLEVLLTDFSLPVEALAEPQRRWTLLHLASYEGRAAVVQLLLQKGANAGARDDEGRTPLHLVTSAEAAESLVRQGRADLHALDHLRRTPLHHAAKNNALSVAKLFLSHKMRRRKTLLTQLLTWAEMAAADTGRRDFYSDEDVFRRLDAEGRTAYTYAGIHGGAIKAVFDEDKKQMQQMQQLHGTVAFAAAATVALLLSLLFVPGTAACLGWLLWLALRLVFLLVRVFVAAAIATATAFGGTVIMKAAKADAATTTVVVAAATVTVFVNSVAWLVFG